MLVACEASFSETNIDAKRAKKTNGTKKLKGMYSFVVNIASGFGGNMASIGANLVLVRLIIDSFGLSSYGIYTLYLVILASITILDLGIGVTVVREIGRLRFSDTKQANKIANSYETIYLLIAALLFFLAISPVSNYLLTTATNGRLSEGFSNSTAMLIWLLVAVRWPVSFYNNVLSGFESFKLLNSMRALNAGLLILGTVLAISVFEVSFEALLKLHIAIGAVYALTLRIVSFRQFEVLSKIRFELKCIKTSFRFTLGAMLASALSAGFISYDRFIASFTLDLDSFGRYSIVAYMTLAVVQVVYPISGALFARVSSGIGQELDKDNRIFYYFSLRVVALSISLVTIVISLFGNELLNIWLADGELVDSLKPVLPVVLVGMFAYGLQAIPASFILSNGGYKFLVVTRAIMFPVHAAYCFYLFQVFGWQGFALSWALSSFVALLILLYFSGQYTNRTFLSSAKKIVVPAVAVLMAALILILEPFEYFGAYRMLVMSASFPIIVTVILLSDWLCGAKDITNFR